MVFRKDAEYMIRWVDKLLEISNREGRYRSDADKDKVQEVYYQARSYYEGVLKLAKSVWKD